jgi:transposase
MVHSLEEKLEVIEMHKQGAGIKRIAKRLGLSKSLISLWLEQYKQHGIDGFQRLPYNCRYNFKEKCQIICEIEGKHVPLHVVSAKYRVARSTLRCWRHIVRNEGYEALREVKYGRKYASMGRPKKKEPVTELEKLQRENELLRAENAYLKKLRALMTEKDRLSIKTKP